MGLSLLALGLGLGAAAGALLVLVHGAVLSALLRLPVAGLRARAGAVAAVLLAAPDRGPRCVRAVRGAARKYHARAPIRFGSPRRGRPGGDFPGRRSPAPPLPADRDPPPRALAGVADRERAGCRERPALPDGPGGPAQALSLVPQHAGPHSGGGDHRGGARRRWRASGPARATGSSGAGSAPSPAAWASSWGSRSPGPRSGAARRLSFSRANGPR